MKTTYKITLVLSLMIICLISLVTYQYKDQIYIYYRDNILKERENLNLTGNEYTKDDTFLFVSNTDDFILKDKDQIKNVFYTIINSGVLEFTFYCDDAYITCIEDVKELANDKVLLSDINNYVHPYNSYTSYQVSYTLKGEITLGMEKSYSKNNINELNKKADSILKEITTDEMTKVEKIRAIHDYIIKNGKYAQDEYIEANPQLEYNLATGILLQGYGRCNSYSDAMAIFLDILKIPNYKIATETHVWNLVKIEDKWLHLDLTWDDDDLINKNTVSILFFLIDNKRLWELDKKYHNFNQDIYLEKK